MDKTDQKTILITGGAGFVGSNLIGYLLNLGNKVIVIDNFYSGRKENIQEYVKNENFSLFVYDIRKPIKFLKNHKIDEIYHLASLASPDHYLFDPVATLETNVLGAKNILDLALEKKAKILFTSTSEVYGDPLVHPQDETYFGNVNPIGRRSCYDEGKRAAETLFMDYHRQYGLDIRIVRLFNVYGPKMAINDGRVISNFVVQALENQKISIYGDGSHTRSFMYIDDLLSALILVMEQTKDIEPINLGNPQEYTILELAEITKLITKSNSDFEFVDLDSQPGRLDDPKVRKPDITKAKSLINWEPKTQLQDGLIKTIEHFKSVLGNKDRICILSTAYFPIEGPAEQMVREITRRLGYWEFDLITAKLSNLESFEKISNVNIYRLGNGRTFDKYIFPFLAMKKFRELNKKNNYSVLWSVMATYAGLAAFMITVFIKRIPLMITMDKGEASKRTQTRAKIIYPVYSRILKHSHVIISFNNEINDKLKMLKNEKSILNIISEDNISKWDVISKKVKETLQRLEILGTRLNKKIKF